VLPGKAILNSLQKMLLHSSQEGRIGSDCRAPWNMTPVIKVFC